ncbi:MAG: hypothetical protein LBQ66_02490 [Planctomycetaceae bacterium]|nr:hypothetical protein [Planctomycetaceae bacterium]
MRVGDPAVGEYADATAWQSVAHLTFTNTFWRSVPTCSVLFYYALRRAGRPRSSPFPLRGIFFPCREAANFFSITRSNTFLPNASSLPASTE